jgi:hypothetical protein
VFTVAPQVGSPAFAALLSKAKFDGAGPTAGLERLRRRISAKYRASGAALARHALATTDADPAAAAGGAKVSFAAGTKGSNGSKVGTQVPSPPHGLSKYEALAFEAVVAEQVGVGGTTGASWQGIQKAAKTIARLPAKERLVQKRVDDRRQPPQQATLASHGGDDGEDEEFEPVMRLLLRALASLTVKGLVEKVGGEGPTGATYRATAGAKWAKLKGAARWVGRLAVLRQRKTRGAAEEAAEEGGVEAAVEAAAEGAPRESGNGEGGEVEEDGEKESSDGEYEIFEGKGENEEDDEDEEVDGGGQKK